MRHHAAITHFFHYYLIFILTIAFNTSAFGAVRLQSGNNQAIQVGFASQDITFQALDANNNPLINDTLNFSVRTETNILISGGATPPSSPLSTTGTASTRFNATNLAGTYTITASLTSNPADQAVATIRVFAGIPSNPTVIAGGNQTVPAGISSNPVRFKVADALGNPLTGYAVGFTLTNPRGQNANTSLIEQQAITDTNGEVSTRLAANNLTGTYILTAFLIQEPTKSIATSLIVVAGTANSLTTIRNITQTIPPAKDSASIGFKVTDIFGNPISNQTVTFRLRLPAGTETTAGLSAQSANSNSDGEVNVILKATNIQGSYLITASTTGASSSILTSTASLVITDGLSGLPSLGLGGAVLATGANITTQATFSGGISVNDGDLKPEAILRLADRVSIRGAIQVDPIHAGQLAELLVIAGYRPLEESAQTFFMLDIANQIQAWNGELKTLIPFRREIRLSPLQTLEIFTGQFIATGRLRIFFGYRLSSGAIVFNAKETINIVIQP